MNNKIPQNTRRGLKEEEAADYIGMSRPYLRQARMNGSLKTKTDAPPFIKIGRAVRYLREDLDAWLEQRKKYSHTRESE